MPTNDYHLEEYIQLMEDRINRIKEIRQLEVLVVGGLAAIYAWLASVHISSLVLWFAPVLLPLFGLYRALMLKRSVGKLNAYIRKLEAVFNQDSPGLEGFESWRAVNPPSGVTRSSLVFWCILVLLTLIAPRVLRTEIPSVPSPPAITAPAGSVPVAPPVHL
ncbi:MAG TPA: hypothetical protein VGM23_00160 [Armatimonadota bacterium]